MDGHSKREVLEIFDMNRKNVIARFLFLTGRQFIFWASNFTCKFTWLSGAYLPLSKNLISMGLQVIWTVWYIYLLKSIKMICKARLFALCATEHVLSKTVSLSKILQGKNVDLTEAVKEASVVIKLISWTQREMIHQFGKSCLSEENS